MTVNIHFSCDNAAFEGEGAPIEMARILRELAAEIHDGLQAKIIRDINGNRIGRFELVDDK